MDGTENSNGVVESGWNHMWRETEDEDSRVRNLCKLVCARDPRMRIRNPCGRNSIIQTGEYGIRIKLYEDGIRERNPENPESECIDMGANPYLDRCQLVVLVICLCMMLFMSPPRIDHE